MLQKVFAEILSKFLGAHCTIVPCNYHKELGGQKYWEMLERNNDFHDNTYAIMLHNVHHETLTEEFHHPSDKKFNNNLYNYMSSIGVQFVEPTNNTAMTCKFICVVHHHDRENIQSQLRIFLLHTPTALGMVENYFAKNAFKISNVTHQWAMKIVDYANARQHTIL